MKLGHEFPGVRTFKSFQKYVQGNIICIRCAVIGVTPFIDKAFGKLSEELKCVGFDVTRSCPDGLEGIIFPKKLRDTSPYTCSFQKKKKKKCNPVAQTRAQM